MEFVMAAKSVFIMRFEHRALLGLTLLVKVAIRYGHVAGVKRLQRSAASASWVRYLSLVGVQRLHLS